MGRYALILSLSALAAAGCGTGLPILRALTVVPSRIASTSSRLNRDRAPRIALPDGMSESAFTAQIVRDLRSSNGSLRTVWIEDDTDVAHTEFPVLLGFDRRDGCYLDEAWVVRSRSGEFIISRYGDARRIECFHLR